MEIFKITVSSSKQNFDRHRLEEKLVGVSLTPTLAEKRSMKMKEASTQRDRQQISVLAKWFLLKEAT